MEKSILGRRELTWTKLAARLKIQAKMTKVPFPPEFEVLSQLVGGVPGVRYAEKLNGIFYLHWERFWLGVDSVLLVNVGLSSIRISVICCLAPL